MEVADLFVLKDGRRLGPYTMGQLIDFIEAGKFSYDDVCLRRGDADTMRLRDIVTCLEALPSFPLAEPADYELAEPAGYALAEPAPAETQLLYRGHPSALNYLTSIALSVGGLVGAIAVFFANPALLPWAIGFALITAFRIWYTRLTNVYLVSAERVEVIQGLIAKSSKEVRVRDIRAINVIKRFPAGWLDVGNVEISSAAGGNVEVLFKGVRGPHRIKKLIRQFQGVQA